ncbi:membrane protein [Planctomycetales bacterium]|nr:membrane protein [Planctomycetales bacterium]
MLGTAVMIIVNAVMLGFTSEMENRMHGILSDVIFESLDVKGFPDADWHIKKIRDAAGTMIEDMTPTIVVPGMVTFHIGTEAVSRPIELIGIDTVTQGKVSEIMKYLQHPENRKNISFQLREGGYDVTGEGSKGRKGVYRHQMGNSGWNHRRNVFAEQEKFRKKQEDEQLRLQRQLNTSGYTLTQQKQEDAAQPADPFAASPSEPSKTFDPAKEQHTGAIIGIGLSAYSRYERTDSKTGEKQVIDKLALIPGDDVMLTFPTTSVPLKLQSDSFTVTDLYESKMMEYDSRLVFVPIEKLQQLRGMYSPETGRPMVSQILIKAKPGVRLNELRDKLQAAFPAELYRISTWRDVQETLLAAVFTEVAILNVLLFLIFAVAGFGILAIFYMIVVEKTKDIGILKSLGASGTGVMQIFLYYSLLLGIIGSVSGLILGLVFVHYIKEIADILSTIMQHEVFDPAVYSFYEIPAIIQPMTVFWIMFGAILIAVLSGVLPACRAARLHPVESLRT